MSSQTVDICDCAGCRSMSDTKCALCGKDVCARHAVEIRFDIHGEGSIKPQVLVRVSPKICPDCNFRWVVIHTIMLRREQMPPDLFAPVFESMRAIMFESDLRREGQDIPMRGLAIEDPTTHTIVQRLMATHEITQDQASVVLSLLTVVEQEKLRREIGR